MFDLKLREAKVCHQLIVGQAQQEPSVDTVVTEGILHMTQLAGLRNATTSSTDHSLGRLRPAVELGGALGTFHGIGAAEIILWPKLACPSGCKRKREKQRAHGGIFLVDVNTDVNLKTVKRFNITETSPRWMCRFTLNRSASRVDMKIGASFV